jgi:hypothetical protein
MPLFVALALACFLLVLLVLLAVRRGAEARRLARLRHAQEEWAEAMDRERGVRRDRHGREVARLAVDRDRQCPCRREVTPRPPAVTGWAGGVSIPGTS